MKAHRLFFLILVMLLAATLPAGRTIKLRPPLQFDNDQAPIAEPKKRNVSEIHAIVYNSWMRHLSPEYKAAKAADPGALNVNAWDEIPDSSWYKNRIGLKTWSFPEIKASLDAGGRSPEPDAWTVTKIGDEGYTPKVYITDPSGQKYVLKFDLPTALERNSAAERICTLIMHAAGYNVPHNSITYFHREDLNLSQEATYTDAIGNKRPMTLPIFESLVQKLKPMPDGRYRGLASFLLKGNPVGLFVYVGKRKDDPNDLIPHEFRRELRGLRVIASWINHVDVGDKNAQDMFIPITDKDQKDPRGFVRHYLLDFGSTMGSGDFINGPYRVGHEYIFDGPAIGKSFITFGGWRRPWDVQGEIPYPEVGYFQAEIFNPTTWKPNYPNLAFEQMDDADGYWGAKIVTAFTDDTILQLAQSGEYSRAGATQYVADVLKMRRDAIGRYWFDRVTPLEGFSLAPAGSGYRLSFRDLALERGYERPENRSYRFRLETTYGKLVIAEQGTQPGSRSLEFPGDLLMKAPQPNIMPDRFGRVPTVRLLIQAVGGGGARALPIEVVLGYKGDRTQLEVLGWYHAPKQ